MFPRSVIGSIVSLLLVVPTVMDARAGAAESLSASYIESRLVLGVAAPEGPVGEWLPDGWSLFTLPKGPFAGANLLVVLADRHLERDADGAPTDPSDLRAVIFASFGLKEGDKAPRLFVTRVYTTNPDNNPYGVALPAAISRESSLSGASGKNRVQAETWTVAPEAGGEFRLLLTHEVGALSWNSGESRVFSATDPDFFRIYRDQQLDGLAMSAAMNRPLVGDLKIFANLPEFEEVFDGSGSVVGIVARPILVREVFLP